MIAEMFTPCSALLAHTLDIPWINHWPISPAEPFSNAQWAGSNRKLFQPNPLSYYPQFRSKGTGPTTQYMVGHHSKVHLAFIMLLTPHSRETSVLGARKHACSRKWFTRQPI